MIKIERGPEPAWWARYSQEKWPRWERFFSDATMRDRRPEWEPERSHRAQELLRSLSLAQSGRCAFCETPLPLAGRWEHVEHLRPRTNAETGRRGDFRSYYFWLAFEWRNILLSCKTCDRSKRNLWPIQGEPGEVRTPWDELRVERPLLLDPFEDTPEHHLVVLENGHVVPRRGDRRASTTIDVLNLMRPELIDARKAVWHETLGKAREILTPSIDQSTFEERFPPSCPHPSVVRAALISLEEGALWRQGVLMRLRLFRSFDGSTVAAAGPRPPTPPRQASPPKTKRLGKRYIRSIEVERFKGLSDIVLEIDREDDRHARWVEREGAPANPSAPMVPALAILGENASGKTSLLQSVALALAQHTIRYKSADFLPTGEDRGRVRVTLTDGSKVTVSLVRGRLVRRRLAPKDLPLLVLGSTFAARPSRRKPPALGRPVVHELFQETTRTARIERWLSDLEVSRERDAIEALRILLDQGETLKFEHAGPGRPLYVRMHGELCTVSTLSAGYQWMIGIAVELMALFRSRDVDIVNGTAVAIIDEFGAALHPQWKMTALGRLRQAFPGVQFIFSTHDPLCLRGVFRGEVARMDRDEEGIFVDQDLPSPEGLRADQLLCSDLFGLSSTVDPDLDDLLQEYRALHRRYDRSSAEESRYNDLRVRLASTGVLGQTERERILFEVIDAYLARLNALRRQSLDAREMLRLEMYRALWSVVGATDPTRAEGAPR